MWRFQTFQFLLLLAATAAAEAASPVVQFEVRSMRSGKWSEARTWVNGRAPRSGDNVQVRNGHVVTYDANSDDAIRVLHVAGTLRFAQNKSTQLKVGLLKVAPGEECGEDGFNCHETAAPVEAGRAPVSAVVGGGTRPRPHPPQLSANLYITDLFGDG